MDRAIAVIGAPSSIGIRPYDDGTVRGLDRTPVVLRDRGLVARLGAHDVGDVIPPPYRDFTRPGRRPRNETEVQQYSRALGAKVAEAGREHAFVLLLGGDCSVVLGSLVGARAGRKRVGLIYIDAHGDFATSEESHTGSVASMCAALAVGRGESPLAHLGGDQPLVRPEDLVVIGRRDDAESPWYGQEVLRAGPMVDLTGAWIAEHGTKEAARAALVHMQTSGVDGFWIHVDADVLDPSVIPAVDSPEPGGLELDEMADLLTPLVRQPGAIGLELTIYDPTIDPERTSADRLVELLARVLAPERGEMS